MPKDNHQTNIQKLAEKSLAELDWQAAFDSLPDIVTINDTEFNILRTNAAAREFMKTANPEGKCYNYFHKSSVNHKDCPCKNALITGKHCLTEFYEPTLNKFLEVRAIPQHDSNGNIQTIVHIVRDITDRKHTENALRESEEKLRLIFETSDVGIVLGDANGNLIQVNPAFCMMIGYSINELLRMNFKELSHPEDLSEELRMIQILIDGDFPYYTIEKRYITKQKNVIWVNLTVSIKRYKTGLPQYFIGIIEEITSRKIAEEELKKAKDGAEAASRTKSEFLANMSHELRTPLNAILGFTRLMQHSKNLTPVQHENLRIIEQSGTHLLDLINDILETSRIEVGRLSLEETGFDLHELLNSLKDMFEFRSREKGLNLIYEQTTELPRYVRTDERKLRQVIINLLGNAVKFTDQGYCILRVGYRKPYRLTVEVQDTGIGIAPEEINLLFKTFGQTSAGRRFKEGTGLGLAISQRYVQLMGGDIHMESPVCNASQGTLFRFDIRAEPIENDAILCHTINRKVIGLAPNQPIYHILIAEDEESNRSLMFMLLESVGFNVRTATNGKDAIAVWKEWIPDMIFMDMRMPVLNGYEAVKKIREMEKAFRCKIIALTAGVFETEKQAALSAGCDDFVPKPFNEIQIFKKIAQHLNIEYIYEETNHFDAPLSTENIDLTKDQLKELPKEWINEFSHAVTRCRKEPALKLIENIRHDHPELANALTNLVNEFRFDRLMVLVGSIGGK